MITKNLIMHHISQAKDERGLLVGEIKKRIQETWKEAQSFSINTVRRAVYELVDDGYLTGTTCFNNSIRYKLSDKPNDINLFYIGVGKLDDDSFTPSYARLWEGKDEHIDFINAIVEERKHWLESEDQYILIHDRKLGRTVFVDDSGFTYFNEDIPIGELFSEQYCNVVFGF